MAFTFSVITDEISGDLEAGLRFAIEEGLGTIDVRSIGGVNFLSLDAAGQTAAGRRIRDAGLKVGCLATPILKWSPPGKGAATSGDQFGFDMKGRTTDQLYEDAFQAAERLGTRHLRIFSFLTYDGFRLADLEPDYARLLTLAERRDCVLHVENEPVCNILSVGDLIALMEAWRHPRLKSLLDIGNAYHASAIPTAAEIAAVMPSVDQIHFKDHVRAREGYVAMGEGDIPYAVHLGPHLAEAAARGVALTIETHVPGDQPGATRRSLAGLRALAALAG